MKFYKRLMTVIISQPSAAMVTLCVMVVTIPFFSFAPKGALASDAEIRESDAGVMVGGEISGEPFEIEGGLASLPLEDAYDLSDVDVDLADYDILINVPVQLENIRENVDRLRVTCSVGEGGFNGTNIWWNWYILYMIEENLIGSEYSETIRFPLTIPPPEAEAEVAMNLPDNIEPTDVNYYYCGLLLHDQVENVWRWPVTAADPGEFSLPWLESTTSWDELTTHGTIEW